MDAYTETKSSKVWLITGCSSGFGLSLARKAFSEGHVVIATARKLEDLEKEFSETTENLCLKQLDVADPGQIRQIVSEVTDKFGRIDVLVNNAACGLVGALEETTPDEIRLVFDTNFLGAVFLTQAVLPHMRQQRSGHIINMSAIAGFYNEMGFSIYGASKFALEGMSEALRAEVAPFGIKVTVVEPGPFRTQFIEKSLVQVATKIDEYQRTSGKFAKMLFSINGKQPGDPEAAARVILQMTEAPKPPFKLVLGKYAQDRFKNKLKQLSEEFEEWQERSGPTEFEQLNR